ncbi:MAG TPA: histidine phosphatase family protein [Anaerolineae bacterium]|nr:histidine phosphatase family protein [Anaerolineae bacterium]
MTRFYLIRHGETAWAAMRARGARGRDFNFVELTQTGVAQIEALAHDERLKSAEAVISSPYTRALQSAAILSRRFDLPLHIEYDLHEWLYDRDPYAPFVVDEVERRRLHFYASDRFNLPGEECAWESACEVRLRAEAVLRRYQRYSTAIVACHIGVIFALTGMTKVGLAEVVDYARKRET